MAQSSSGGIAIRYVLPVLWMTSHKKTTMPYPPIHPLHFTWGQKSAAPTRVNLGPRHISETIAGRKLKLYVHLHRVKYIFGI